MKTKMLASIAALAVAAGVAYAPDAHAGWWQRVSGLECHNDGSEAYSSAAGSLIRDYYEDGAQFWLQSDTSTKNLLNWAYCGFTNGGMTPNYTINGIAVDMTTQGGDAIPAAVMGAWACVYSGWTKTCGAVSQNPAIDAQSHGTIYIGDLSAWRNDSAAGYPFVRFEMTPNHGTGVNISGIVYWQ